MTNEGYGVGNRFYCVNSWFPFELSGNRHFPLENSGKLNWFYSDKKESYMLRRICVTCKLEKQNIICVYCTENCFYLTIWKFLGKYPLRKYLVYLTAQMPGMSDRRARQAQNKCNTSVAQTTRVGHEYYTNVKSATRVITFDFHNDTSENILSHTYIDYMAKKDYKERNNFNLRTTFWKCLVPMRKCVWKKLHEN